MCYNISIISQRDFLEKRFKAFFKKPDLFKPAFHVSAFKHSAHPIIAGSDSENIQMFSWGLIPHWAGTKAKAQEIRKHTANARAETIFTKPSYRSAASQRHCLVLVDGFYEYRHFKGKSYPYYIRLQSREPFSLAGLWEQWTQPDTQNIHSTFTVITVDANPLLAQVHNSKKRMPVILQPEHEQQWLQPAADQEAALEILKPYQGDDLEAYPVSRLINQKGADSNKPEAIKACQYEELPPLGEDADPELGLFG